VIRPIQREPSLPFEKWPLPQKHCRRGTYSDTAATAASSPCRYPYRPSLEYVMRITRTASPARKILEFFCRFDPKMEFLNVTKAILDT
jgi:hypothetical protein